MGGSQSREGLEISDSEAEEEEEEDRRGRSAGGAPSTSYESPGSSRKISTLDDAEARLRSLSLKYASSSPSSEFSPATTPNAAKLYLHVGGSAPDARWIVSEKLVSYSFRKSAAAGGAGSSDGESDDDGDESASWFLEVGSKIRVRIDPGMQLKTFPEQRRVDFVAAGVWAMKFFSAEAYTDFYNEYQNCFFENMYGMEANEENKMKIYGKEFMGWAKPELADDTMWEDAEESFEKKPPAIYSGLNQDLLKQFEEVATDDGGGIQSLALGALDNSFLVSDSGIQVVKNFSHGIHGKGITVKLAKNRSSTSASSATPTKALLMKAETNMLVMSPGLDGQPRSAGVQQVDIETGKAVGEWKFEKDGTGIRMRDITNDSKAAQLDPSESTFLGLDDNALCRWDMRERKGKVQRIANAADSPVMEWTQGHHFSRGTDFLSFAATGDGSIAVGSRDGRIRLYSKSSMRTAKTAFPGLGSPITHVDVTYDGRWILGTTDSYLVLICTVFKDKEGKEKTGFSGRMGNRIAAPRLLKLSPLDAQQAGQNKFKGGHFSWVTEGGKQERHVVATMGKVSVVWSFARVKDGQHKCYKLQQGLKSCYCYKVVPREESIVDSRFMHDNFAISEAPLVVATPLKVSSFTLSPT